MPSPTPPRPLRRRAALAVAALLLAGVAAAVVLRPDSGVEEEPASSEHAASRPPVRARPSSPDEGDAGDEGDGNAPGEVAVRVLGAGQAPLAGARVQLVPLDAPHGALPPSCPCADDEVDAGPDPAEPLSVLDPACSFCPAAETLLFEDQTRGGGFLPEREVRTDAQGVARFPVPGGELGYALWIEAGGYMPATLLAEVVDPGDAPTDVELAAARAVQVRIEDAEGRPLPDASLAVYLAQPFRALGPVRHGATHALSELPSGGELHLLARAPGHLPADTICTDEAEEPVVVVLPRPRRLSGQVLHGDAPVAGATLHLRSDAFRGEFSATSDRDGHFVIEEAPEGSFVLSGQKGALSGELPLEIGEQTAEVALVLQERVRVQGTVTDAATGAPLEGAAVMLHGDNDSFDSATTDAAGHYQLETAPGAFTLAVSEDKHLSATVQLKVVEGQPLVQDMALPSGNQLTGRVVDGHGQPVAGAQVEAEPADGSLDPGRASRSVETDAQGLFALAGLTDGAQVVAVQAADHPPLVERLSLPSREVTLRLHDGTIIEGEVHGPQGPLESARIEVGSSRDGRSAETDAAGHFRVAGLEAGTTTVLAMAEGLAPSDPVQVNAQEGQVARVRITLSQGLEIRGKVQDDRGAPIAEAMVEAYPDAATRAPLPGRNASGTSAADGSFSLGGLHAGSYFVYAYRDGLSQSRPLPVAAGTTAITLTLTRGARVTGRVVSRGGGPVRRFTVEGQDFHSADGSFVLKDTSADAHELFIEGPFPTRRVEVQLRAGETTDVGDVVVDEGDALRGLVRGLDGRPVPGAQVVALPPGLDPSSGAETDSDAEPLLDSPRNATADAEGRFTFEHLRPGSYLLQASGRGAASAPVHASSKGGEVELQLLPGASVHGRAVLEDGTPTQDGVAIYVSGAVTAQVRVVGGLFEFSGLPPGDGQLMVTGGNRERRAGNQALTLSAGEVREVAVTVAQQPRTSPRASVPPPQHEAAEP